MARYTTLTDYINIQIEKFDIPNTEKNQNKLRIKFTRTLQKLGYWENAEKKIIGRNETRLFTDEQLNHLSHDVETYLLKQGNIDIEELEEYRQSSEEYIEKQAFAGMIRIVSRMWKSVSFIVCASKIFHKGYSRAPSITAY